MWLDLEKERVLLLAWLGWFSLLDVDVSLDVDVDVEEVEVLEGRDFSGELIVTRRFRLVEDVMVISCSR